MDAPVAALGIDPDSGQMEVPANVSEVGWYRHGPVPGEPGSSVMAAHVDLSGPGHGVFWSLGELDPGDRIIVDYAGGTCAEFTVEARNIYLKTELPVEAIFSRGGTPVLTLVTCGGGFNTRSGATTRTWLSLQCPSSRKRVKTEDGRRMRVLQHHWRLNPRHSPRRGARFWLPSAVRRPPSAVRSPSAVGLPLRS